MKQRKFAVSRRGLIKLGALSLVASPTIAVAQALSDDLVLEEQWGDLSLAPETIEFNPYQIGELSTSRVQGSMTDRIKSFRSNFLEIAGEFEGYNRSEHENEITRFLNLFRLDFRYGARQKYTPYCAAGVSYVAALTYWREANTTDQVPTLAELRAFLIEVGSYHFYPTVSVIDMYHVALGTRRWIARSDTPEPGWLVLFDWKQNGGANHVGIVESVILDEDQTQPVALNTLEFNTVMENASGSQRDGGYVARRVRSLNGTIKGYINTDARNPFR
ncbi:MAG: CHAP domain-containing protein [Pseudomonadota bacterium]